MTTAKLAYSEDSENTAIIFTFHFFFFIAIHFDYYRQLKGMRNQKLIYVSNNSTVAVYFIIPRYINYSVIHK